MFVGAFIAIAVLNLVIADRLAPTALLGQHASRRRALPRAVRPSAAHRALRRGHLVRVCCSRCRPRRSGSSGCCSATASRSAIDDPQFGNDVGFYVFRAAVHHVRARLVVRRAVASLLLLTIADPRAQRRRVFAPPRPKVRSATKAHIAVLLALLAVLKAGDYWVTRYELTTERRGFVQGATYSVVNAQLPAVVLLALIALLVGGLFLSTLKTDSWRLPLVASALWWSSWSSVASSTRRRPGAGGNPNQKDTRGAVHRAQHRRPRARRWASPDVARDRGRVRHARRRRVTDDADPLSDVRLLNPDRVARRGSAPTRASGRV